MSESFLWLLRDARGAQEKRCRCDQVKSAQSTCRDGRLRTRELSVLSRVLPRSAEDIEDPKLLPVTDKKKLMARFDDWSSDREVTIEKVRAFVDNPELIGARFLGRCVAPAQRQCTIFTLTLTMGLYDVFFMGQS